MEKSFETNNILHFLLWEIKCRLEEVNKHMEILDKLITHDLVKEEPQD